MLHRPLEKKYLLFAVYYSKIFEQLPKSPTFIEWGR